MMHQTRTIYSVQAFRLKGSVLEAEAPQAVDDAIQALRRVTRIAHGKAGAVAVRVDVDPDTQDAPEPVVLRIVGQVPEVFLDQLPF
ncbi:hypothetical protein [Methylobacterium sp. J-070]|uniref:hypothetical protein n=1 Tax=Methylobacterium sp. J-070 TaxID=2836650 RepID=UPI001FB8D40E|nr:hypothetical protein [Methylobacterium sp. J-070]MCJ2050862.1 hypothetical protein [Methylobacterium sp. J-070]